MSLEVNLMAARASVTPKKSPQKPDLGYPSAEIPPVEIPMEERIRLRAYELYLRRGGEDGSDIDDWLQAETEMAGEMEQAAKRGE